MNDLLETMRRLVLVDYFENPYIPEFDTDGERVVYHLKDDDIFLVHPNNTAWFLDSVKQAGKVPNLLSWEDWAKKSEKRFIVGYLKPIKWDSEDDPYPRYEPKWEWHTRFKL